MAIISFDPRLNVQVEQKQNNHGVVVDEIQGLIKFYKDGYVERPPIIPSVPCTMALEVGMIARDVVINKMTNSWGRIYVSSNRAAKMPLIVYFHGGGFCVGSAAWRCYHEFLSSLASRAGCVILTVNYRLAPENRLPAAYEDGVHALMWVKNQALSGSNEQNWWISRCNFSNLFIAGDSAGANIAYNVTLRVASDSINIKPLLLKGTILIQPFFGGEARTASEKHSAQPASSALTLSASDTYWRLSLPLGANRDHPWCNPLAKGSASKLHEQNLQATMVCISELDILKDRNLEFCSALAGAGKRVETKIYKGVGHAFQILHNYQLAQIRIHEMLSHLQAFINQ
ncbi:hypothetical protein SLA2020_085730 [Shorea laevis]